MKKQWNDPFNSFNSWKIAFWPEHFEGIQQRKLLPPISVTIDPTNRCAFKCIWCLYRFYTDYHKEELTHQELMDLADFLGTWKVQSACIAGGGEPCLNEATPDLITKLHNLGIEVGVITNGFLMENGIQEALARGARWTGISVDAGNAADYAEVHGCAQSAFQKTLSNIGELCSLRDKKKSKITVGFKFLIHPLNYSGLRDAVKIAKDLGCNDFHARPCYLNDSKYSWSESAVEEVRDSMESILSLESKDFRVFGISHKFNPDFTRKIAFEKCNATPFCLTFGADGNMWLCCDRRYVDGFNLGPWYPVENIKERWNSKFHWELIDAINPKQCGRCTYEFYNEMYERAWVVDSMTRKFV